MDVRVAVRSNTLPFTPVSLLFRDIKYIVPVDGGERTLLNGVSGYCLPGTLTALMGSSGQCLGCQFVSVHVVCASASVIDVALRNLNVL